MPASAEVNRNVPASRVGFLSTLNTNRLPKRGNHIDPNNPVIVSHKYPGTLSDDELTKFLDLHVQTGETDRANSTAEGRGAD